ncbi:hypothetical protein HOK51_07665 [Candidatus Woesearchaeota archaeon]|jgi:hypothetical protein|nr:hypothetical protein [Candidatus Woesearchaeota archaeon]MBT6519701.1 hypothetical protein [Candidatus Woesearchaeota archaeon]MBT7367392.1 hypothetical protein [Candidatus Woesearchaeota archaeon]
MTQIEQSTQVRENLRSVQNSLALKKLKGIKPKGVKFKPTTNLERLISAGKEISKYTTELLDLMWLDVSRYYPGDLVEPFTKLAESLEFSDQDLADWIDYSYSDVSSFAECIVPGFFASCLLNEFTKRKHQDDKLSVFHFDGAGNKYDYLFAFTTNVDVLILNNLEGNYISHNLGFRKWEKYTAPDLGIIAGVNVTGDHNFTEVKFNDANCQGLFGFNVLGKALYGIRAGYYFEGAGGNAHSRNFTFFPRRVNMMGDCVHSCLDYLKLSKNEIANLSSDEVFKRQYDDRCKFSKRVADNELDVWKEMNGAELFDLLRYLAKNPCSKSTKNQIVNIAQTTYKVGKNYEY